MTTDIDTDDAPRLDPTFKAEWTAALRSGKYKQGIGALRQTVADIDKREDRFCCLGVACDLIDPDAWRGGLRQGWGIAGPSSTMSLTWVVEARMAQQAHDLAVLNDGGDYDFNAIADWIDEHL